MSPKRQLPNFKSEAEEAQWWYEQREKLDDYLDLVEDDGTPLHVKLELTPKSKTKAVSLRLAIRDIERTKILAARKGIGYQTMLKILVHEGLEREEGKIQAS